MTAPLLVTGMHRSGTSLLARLLSRLDLAMGGDFPPADAGNPDGYFEDRSVLAFNRSLLRRLVPAGEEGWPDWGWTRSGVLASACSPEWLDGARRCLNRLAEQHASPWAVKDPRFCLLLDLWLRVSPDSLVLAIYRHPCDVVDALQRVRPPLFLEHPSWCVPIWLHYNRPLLALKRRHPDRCLLLSAQRLVADIDGVAAWLSRRLLPQLPTPSAGSYRSLLRVGRLACTSPTSHLRGLYRSCAPDAEALHADLEALADRPSLASPAAASPPAIGPPPGRTLPC
ncbi:hypothetical protein EVJ50_06485 [Synechococcus sp. RSCCF101]|uniref:sulfotransferase n=1 Tax=Synechococcus sp. RSCCF101 TaxID=2511069 RepID=UPI001246DD21|nr:sulfotransferase [Synechococcus sp. RSCCF101]QEY31941.1 hypothetical protein EVJ50_06485 [Synechococcus sp. RSCCF101]